MADYRQGVQLRGCGNRAVLKEDEGLSQGSSKNEEEGRATVIYLGGGSIRGGRKERGKDD